MEGIQVAAKGSERASVVYLAGLLCVRSVWQDQHSEKLSSLVSSHLEQRHFSVFSAATRDIFK